MPPLTGGGKTDSSPMCAKYTVGGGNTPKEWTAIEPKEEEKEKEEEEDRRGRWCESIQSFDHAHGAKIAWCNKPAISLYVVCLFYVAIQDNFCLINFSYCLELQQVFLDLFMLLCTRRIIASTPPTVAKKQGTKLESWSLFLPLQHDERLCFENGTCLRRGLILYLNGPQCGHQRSHECVLWGNVE